MSLIALLLLCVILGTVAVLAAKIVPEVSEYMDIVRVVKTVAADPAVRGSVRDIKIAFSKRADVAYIKSITADDLDITKDGDDILIDFAYTKKIHLIANASLLLEFEGSSSQQKEE
ncbi:MAG: DUF4845 domain-containing protein [Georgfuchsia sp.]